MHWRAYYPKMNFIFFAECLNTRVASRLLEYMPSLTSLAERTYLVAKASDAFKDLERRLLG